VEEISSHIRQWISSSMTDEEVDGLAKLVPITDIERFLLTTPLWQSIGLVALVLGLILGLIWLKVKTVEKRRKILVKP
jgi:hypothetical protein